MTAIGYFARLLCAVSPAVPAIAQVEMPVPTVVTSPLGSAFDVGSSWYLVPAAKEMKIVKGAMLMQIPEGAEWQRWSSRPSPDGEIWTKDGTKLNELSFFAGIRNGETLYYGGYGEDGPPKFSKKMLPTDLVDFFEKSNRLLMQTSLFKVDEVKPVKFAGQKATRFTYHYTPEGSQVSRKGEGIAAIIKERLYLVNFTAPETYFFDRDIGEVRKMIDALSLPVPKVKAKGG